MSTGRRDYTWGFVLEYVTAGKYSVNLLEGASQAAEYDQLVDVLIYEVPAGYRLHLSAVCISCNSPADNFMEILKGVDTLIDLYFTVNHMFTPGYSGIVIFDEGETLKVRAKSNDAETIVFKCQVIGILEQKN